MTVDEASVAARLEAYLRVTWEVPREVIPAPPFVAYLHPIDDAPGKSVALPEHPLGAESTEALADGLAAVRAIFASRGRQARVVFFETLAPQLPLALTRAGFDEADSELLLYRTREGGDMSAAPPMIPGLSIDVHSSETRLDEVREGWNTNELGFNPASTRRATDEEAEAFRRELSEARAFLARLDGQPAAAGMFHAPLDGVTELLGIATLEPFRGRGIAAAVTTRMTELAFAHGCDLVFLRPADAHAARVYARVGYDRSLVARAYRERDAAEGTHH